MRLDRSFFDRPTLEVARDVIGRFLVRGMGRDMLAGRIVEAEAYLGHPDRASHASRKDPNRARIMFGPPGFAYVYMVYGMYHCLNLVTESDGVPGAVLVRAVEPVEGVEVMRRMRTRTRVRPKREMALTDLTSGPGRLCQAFGIDRSLNGVDLCGRELWLEDRDHGPVHVCNGPRVGVAYAGEWALKPWRFWEEGCRFVSRAR